MKRLTAIPKYNLDTFRPVHRQNDSGMPFGHNVPDAAKKMAGFEIYSGDGMIPSKGPLRADFYRMTVTVTGSLNMGIGLDQYTHQPGTLAFTFPGQTFSTSHVSEDAAGYYLFFDAAFLNEIIPSIKIADEFPFFDASGTPIFQIATDELDNILALIKKIDGELQHQKTGRDKAVKMYVYLLLLEAKRSYQRQHFDQSDGFPQDSYKLINRFRKLVAQHYLQKRQVHDYAQLLGVSANHLNKTVKESTGRTASVLIKEMLLEEAKSLLLYTHSSVAEIAYRLCFADPAAFNRFFKTLTKETPLSYRSRHN